MRVGLEVNQMPMCCGVYEAGYFRVGDRARGCDRNTVEGWASLLKSTVEHYNYGYQPIFFNFVKPRDEDEYEEGYYAEVIDGYCAGELRQLVMSHPHAHHVGEFFNSNSGNFVDTWYIFDDKANQQERQEDHEDNYDYE